MVSAAHQLADLLVKPEWDESDHELSRDLVQQLNEENEARRGRLRFHYEDEVD